MDSDQFVAEYPEVYHMAEQGSWPSIRKYGLLSASALLDLFEIRGADRFRLESQWRPRSETLNHPVHGRAVIRDQGPLPESELRALLIGMTPREWYELINRKTFFWADMHGLQKLLRAVRYRDRPHDILQVDARALLKRHLQDVTLTDQNSGSVISKRMRGRDTFVKVGEFRARWVTEVAVEHSVPDVADLTLSVEEWKADSRLRSIWSKGSA